MKRPCLFWPIVLIFCAAFFIATSWLLWVKIEEQLSMPADRPRYETIEKIILDGRGPELKKLMKEAVKGKK